LKGLAIGNGWVHPIVQNQAYVDYPYNLGLIGDYEHDVAQSVMDELANCINNGSWFTANDLSNELEEIVVEASGVEIDDVMYSKDPVEPYAKSLKAWFAQKSVQNLIGTTGFKPVWGFVNETVESFFDADEQKSVLPLLPKLIENYRVFIYTGNMDLNVNVAGVDAYIKVMNWKGYPNYYGAKRVLWYTGEELSGYAKNWENLTVLVIRNAGHEVPFYQPAAALDMLNHLLSGQPFE
jgi:vitellogenic carboxypeptidase-like protein